MRKETRGEKGDTTTNLIKFTQFCHATNFSTVQVDLCLAFFYQKSESSFQSFSYRHRNAQATVKF